MWQSQSLRIEVSLCDSGVQVLNEEKDHGEEEGKGEEQQLTLILKYQLWVRCHVKCTSGSQATLQTSYKADTNIDFSIFLDVAQRFCLISKIRDGI